MRSIFYRFDNNFHVKQSFIAKWVHADIEKEHFFLKKWTLLISITLLKSFHNNDLNLRND